MKPPHTILPGQIQDLPTFDADQTPPFALAEACRLEGNVGRWWALDASGAPTQWPVVTPARAKPCECSAAHADEYVAVCDKSCDCLCHE